MIMTLTDEIKKRSVHVDAAINELLPVTHPEELYKASRYLVDAGGKRLRPAVLILAAEAVGSDLQSVLPAAVAVELVHNFTLIHDDIMDKKTSVLYASAAKIGALLGGAPYEIADALSEYGRLIGIGFQMYDDVLDMVTPQEVLGKVRGSDLMEGKHTLIVIDAFQKGVKLDIFAKGKSTQEETDEAVRILTECGSIGYVKDLAISYINEGKAKLDALEDCPEKELLLQIADYMIARKY